MLINMGPIYSIKPPVVKSSVFVLQSNNFKKVDVDYYEIQDVFKKCRDKEFY